MPRPRAQISLQFRGGGQNRNSAQDLLAGTGLHRTGPAGMGRVAGEGVVGDQRSVSLYADETDIYIIACVQCNVTVN